MQARLQSCGNVKPFCSSRPLPRYVPLTLVQSLRAGAFRRTCGKVSCGSFRDHSTETGASTSGHKSSKPDDDDGQDNAEDLDIDSEVFSTGVVAIENLIKATALLGLASVLGGWLKVEPTAHWTLDLPSMFQGFTGSLPALSFLLVLAALPTNSILPELQQKDFQMMTEAEDSVVQSLRIDINLDNPLASADKEEARVPATENPVLAGCRAFQLWATKPYYPQFESSDVTLLLGSSALNVAANELLVRGVVAGFFMNWFRDQFANADKDSILFWGKLFGIANESTYRYLAAAAIIALGLPSMLAEAGRVRDWSRNIIAELLSTSQGAQQQQDDGTGPATSNGDSASASATDTHSSAVMQAKQDSISTSTSPSTSSNDSIGSSSSNSSSSTGSKTSSSASSGGGSTKPLLQQLVVLNQVAYDSDGKDGDELQMKQVIQTQPVPTVEDGVAYMLALAFGVAQLVQTNLVFAVTGNVAASWATRVTMDVAATILVQLNAKGKVLDDE